MLRKAHNLYRTYNCNIQKSQQGVDKEFIVIDIALEEAKF